MLEQFVTDPAVIQRMRSCILGRHLGSFCAGLVDRGYRPLTIQGKLRFVTNLACWMVKKQLAVVDLDERRADQFLDVERRRGHPCRGHHQTMLQLIEHLRSAGVGRPPKPVCDESPLASLLARYQDYLQQERALAGWTVSGYMAPVREFVVEHLDGGAARPDSLDAHDVRRFLLDRSQRFSPRHLQSVGTALRSFLGFLFLRGEIPSNLALAVPRVRRWRLAGVPRHLPPSDVERLLCACDLTSTSGRRDYAVLLLLARLGLRASEVLALDLGDLRWREAEIVVRGKGQVHDRLPLPRDVGEALAEYLQKDRPSGGSRRVFLCRKAPHRGFGHPSTVSSIVAKALTRAGLAPATRGAHLLRHSLATDLIRRGASLAEIGQVLRHRSPTTTEIYAKLDFGSLRDVAMPWPTSGGQR